MVCLVVGIYSMRKGEVSHYQTPDAGCFHKATQKSQTLKMEHITASLRWAMSQSTHTHTWNSFMDVKDHIHIGTGTHTDMVAQVD